MKVSEKVGVFRSLGLPMVRSKDPISFGFVLGSPMPEASMCARIPATGSLRPCLGPTASPSHSTGVSRSCSVEPYASRDLIIGSFRGLRP